MAKENNLALKEELERSARKIEDLELANYNLTKSVSQLEITIAEKVNWIGGWTQEYDKKAEQ